MTTMLLDIVNPGNDADPRILILSAVAAAALVLIAGWRVAARRRAGRS